MADHAIAWVVAVFAGVLALIFAGTRLLQVFLKRQHHRPGRLLALRESVALDSRRRVHVIQCGSKQLILLTGGGQDVVIGWMPEQ